MQQKPMTTRKKLHMITLQTGALPDNQPSASPLVIFSVSVPASSWGPLEEDEAEDEDGTKGIRGVSHADSGSVGTTSALASVALTTTFVTLLSIVKN
jgi:hypothetical protein